MIIVGDLHGRIDILKRILKQFKNEKKLFLGDYVDSFVRPDCDIIDTVKAVLDSDAILLVGNHEFNYCGPFADKIKNGEISSYCSGFERSRFSELNGLLEKNKDRFKLGHFSDNVLYTHAGVTQEWIDFSCDQGLYENWQDGLSWITEAKPFDLSIHNRVFKCGCRGGVAMYAGPLWCDYRYEFKAIKGLNQIFGHTHVPGIFEYDPIRCGSKESRNFCIDCLEAGYDQVMDVCTMSSGDLYCGIREIEK